MICFEQLILTLQINYLQQQHHYISLVVPKILFNQAQLDRLSQLQIRRLENQFRNLFKQLQTQKQAKLNKLLFQYLMVHNKVLTFISKGYWTHANFPWMGCIFTPEVYSKRITIIINIHLMSLHNAGSLEIVIM